MRTCALLLFALASPVWAATLKNGDSIVVREGEVVEDDLYAFGQSIRIEGEVRGDVVAFGRDVTIQGDVAGDVISASRSLLITGTVGGSIRSTGQDLTVRGVVGEDVLVAGANLTLAAGSKVGHDLLAATSRTVLNGSVGGDAQVRTQALDVGREASVAGALEYTSEQAASIDPGASIASVEKAPAPRRPPAAAWFVLSWVRLAIGLFALGLLLSWIAPKLTLSARGMLKHKPWKSLGAGALAAIALPVCVLLLFVVGALVGGWWLGLIALGIAAIAGALAIPVVGLIVGDWLLRNPGHERAQILLALAVGVPLLALLMRVPILGGLAGLAAVLFGLGALLLAGWRLRNVPVHP